MPPPDRRRVVLDADIPWKLVHELHKRGRLDATALKLEKIEDLKDGAVLKALAAGYEPCVFVTFDMIKADGTVMIWADAGGSSVKPLNSDLTL